jgi:hypothetical protein
MVRAEGEPETKLFVNLCYSDKIIQGTCTKTAKGESWHIPYSISKPRPVKDQKGNDAELFDWVCSDATYNKGQTHQRFKTLLTNCALDGVERQYQAVKQVTPKIDKENVVFLKRAFYGEQKPEMQTIKEDDPENPQVRPFPAIRAHPSKEGMHRHPSLSPPHCLRLTVSASPH